MSALVPVLPHPLVQGVNLTPSLAVVRVLPHLQVQDSESTPHCKWFLCYLTLRYRPLDSGTSTHSAGSCFAPILRCSIRAQTSKWFVGQA